MYVLLSGLLPPSAMAAAGNDAVVLVAEICWIAAMGVGIGLLFGLAAAYSALNLGLLRVPP